MSSSLFYQKYRRLFFEDEQEPLAYQIYHSHPSASAVSDLPQWLTSSPPQVAEKLPKLQSKVRLPPLEHSPPSQSRKLEYSPPPAARKALPEPAKPRQLTPLQPPLEFLDQPRRPMLQYEPMTYEPVREDLRTEKPVERSAEQVPKPSIKIVGKNENTRERVFPKGGGGTTPTNPYQTAVSRRKDAKKGVDARRDALRKLINAGW